VAVIIDFICVLAATSKNTTPVIYEYNSFNNYSMGLKSP
jgi:hypothetical protein